MNYKYRLVYRNERGINYAPTYHRSVEAALATVTRFYSVDNDRAGAPRRGEPYVATTVVLQERLESLGGEPVGAWTDHSEYHTPPATAEAAAAHEAAVRARIAARRAASRDTAQSPY